MWSAAGCSDWRRHAASAKAGAPVTLVHLMDRLMERQLDAPAAALKSLVERKEHRYPAQRQHRAHPR